MSAEEQQRHVNYINDPTNLLPPDPVGQRRFQHDDDCGTRLVVDDRLAGRRLIGQHLIANADVIIPIPDGFVQNVAYPLVGPTAEHCRNKSPAWE